MVRPRTRCKLSKEHFRTMLFGLERQLRARVPLDHAITAWLVSRCGALRTIHVRGQDGRTVQQREGGNTGPPKLFSLGELIRWKNGAVEGSGDLKLLEPTEQIRRLLEVTRLSQFFEVYDDEQEALKSFR